MGTPSEEYISKYSAEMKEPMNLPNIPRTGWQRILKKYKPDELFLDLISHIMVYNIEERYSPFEILKH